MSADLLKSQFPSLEFKAHSSLARTTFPPRVPPCPSCPRASWLAARLPQSLDQAGFWWTTALSISAQQGPTYCQGLTPGWPLLPGISPDFPRMQWTPPPGALASGASPTALLSTCASYSSDQLSWTGNYWRWNLHRAGLKSNWRLTDMEQRTPRPSGLCWVSTVRPILSWEK